MKYLLILCLLLSGCASTYEVWKYDPEKSKLVCIYKTRASGTQDTLIKTDRIEASTDNKWEPIKDVVSINAMRN